jgi:hypothetical protein
MAMVAAMTMIIMVFSLIGLHVCWCVFFSQQGENNFNLSKIL